MIRAIICASLCAFGALTALPLTAVAGDAARGQTLSAPCAACHGQDGNGIAPNFPNLAGQNERYLLRQLQAIKDGSRPAPLMAGQLDSLSEADLADLAAHFASLPGAERQASGTQLERGEQIYRAGILAKKVAACTACHSPRGNGNAAAGFPQLAGQPVDYVVAQLVAYREGQRQTDAAYGGMMRDVAGGMTDTEIRAVASYIQGLH